MALRPRGRAGRVRRGDLGDVSDVGDVGDVGERGGGFFSGSDVDAGASSGTGVGVGAGAGAGASSPGAGAGAGAGASAGAIADASTVFSNLSAEKSTGGGGVTVTSSRLCREMVCKPSGERGEAAPEAAAPRENRRGGWGGTWTAGSLRTHGVRSESRRGCMDSR
jgi:hypothetical protein